MSFAVVHFIEDDVFSHVPINWLNASQTECLWPPNNPKNVTHLIKTRTAPGKNWCTYKVVVEGIYESIETAIRKAGDAEYTSNDEEIGRGKRRKNFRKPSTSSSDDREDSISPPPRLEPRLDIEQAQIIWEQPCETESFGMLLEGNSVVSPEAGAVSEGADDTSGVYQSSELSNVTLTRRVIASDPDRIEMKLDKMLAMMSEISLHVEELKEKFQGFERSMKPNQDWKFFEENLPCDNIEDVKKIDVYVEDEKNKQEYIKYLQSIGGSHAKDRVNRIMKTLFTNKFLIGCSWLGLRNNIRASDFRIVQIAEGFATQSFIQRAEFQKIAAEWIRLSALRHKRENKQQN